MGAAIVVALLALALLPAAAWAGRRYGRSLQGGLALGAVLLGLGEVADPPSRHIIEAAADEEESPAPGDPPRPDEAQPLPRPIDHT